jgi:aminoglycoside phosphotransferase (APT) family kinase protein
MAAVAGPRVSPVRQLHGGTVGAWEVLLPDGTSSVLTWRGPQAGRDRAVEAERTSELVAIARRAGIPAPRYEDVVPLRDGGVVVLQEFIAGVRPEPSAGMATSLLRFAERRRGLLTGTAFADEATPLFLTEDGPGFCLHGPLRQHDRRTRRLLDWIEAVGRAGSNVSAGTDLVHFDYHLGNVLADRGDQTTVVAILDWDTAGPGDVAIDGVVLALDLVLYDADARLIEQIADHLVQTTTEDALRASWAHGLLRLVDWRLRHSPDDDLSWLPRAERLAGV